MGQQTLVVRVKQRGKKMVLLWSVWCEHGELIVSSPKDDRIAAIALQPRSGSKPSSKRHAPYVRQRTERRFQGEDNLRIDGWRRNDPLAVAAGARDQLAGRIQEQCGISKQQGDRQLEDFMRLK